MLTCHPCHSMYKHNVLLMMAYLWQIWMIEIIFKIFKLKKKKSNEILLQIFFFFFFGKGVFHKMMMLSHFPLLCCPFSISARCFMSVHVPSKANMPVSHNVPTLKLCLFVYQDLRRKHFFFHEHYCNFFIPHQILNDFPYDGFMRLFLQLNEHDSVIFIKKN